MIKFYQSRLLNDSTLVPQLEKEFCDYVGYKHAVAVDSCTNAIMLCLRYYGIREVAIPAITYVSVAHEIEHSGAKLILTDQYEVGNEYQLQLTDIVDSAHAIQKLTKPSSLTRCYSFYPTKLMPSYEGGMIGTNDEKLATWARLARQMGRDGYGAYYDVKMKGWKCNMTPIQALFALESLHMLPEVLQKSKEQREYYNRYMRPFRDTPHLYIITVEDRDKFIKYMSEKGIECSIHFLPIYDKTCYKNQFNKEDYPYCESIKNNIVSLPLHPFLTKEDQDKVIKAVLAWPK